MPVSADRCKETTTTTGIGNLTLLGASAQHQSFSAAFPNTPQTNIQYCIVGQTGGEWEGGEGTLINPTTFSRDIVRSSSNGNALVSLSAGTKDVFATQTAERTGAILTGPVVPPVLANYSWINQAGATVVQNDTTIYLEGPNVGGSGIVNLHGQTKNVPGSTPYSVIIGFTTNLMAVNTEHVGFMISDGTKIVTFGIQYNSGVSANLVICSFKLTNFSTFSATYLALNCWPRDRWWLKFRDDGVNRNFYFSSDGLNWLLLLTHARTDFLTATTWGFFADPENANWKVGISVFSWAEGT